MSRQKKGTNFLRAFFYYLTETGEFFFTYIEESIGYNSVYLIVARVTNFAVTATFNVHQSSNEIDDYRLVFTVSISLLCNILNACQNKIHEIVAYIFPNVREKIHQFLSSIK